MSHSLKNLFIHKSGVPIPGPATHVSIATAKLAPHLGSDQQWR